MSNDNESLPPPQPGPGPDPNQPQQPYDPAMPSYPPAGYPPYPPAYQPGQTYPNTGAPPAGYPPYPPMQPGQTYPNSGGPPPAGYPETPGAPSSPYYPAPNSATIYPGYPQTGGYPPPWTAPNAGGPMAPDRAVAPLARPLAAWIWLIVAVVALIGVLGAAATGSDWAAGAVRGGLVAIGVGAALILFTALRAALGLAASTNPKRVGQLVGAGVTAVVLVALGATTFGLQGPLHRIQGFALESSHNWQTAINEYNQGGTSAANTANIARTYREWGEQLGNQHAYAAALDKFTTVINNYPQATTEVSKAQVDVIVYTLSWSRADIQSGNYSTARDHLEPLLQNPFCGSNCQSAAGALDATALYQIGKGQIAANSCKDAAATDQSIISRFPTAPEAQSATNDLKASQTVKGAFDSQPVSGVVITFILFNYSDTATDVQNITAILKSPYKGNLGTDGSFTIPTTPPGDYNLGFEFSRGTNLDFIGVEFDNGTSSPPTAKTVAPLCGTDLGTVALNNLYNFVNVPPGTAPVLPGGTGVSFRGDLR